MFKWDKKDAKLGLIVVNIAVLVIIFLLWENPSEFAHALSVNGSISLIWQIIISIALLIGVGFEIYFYRRQVKLDKSGKDGGKGYKTYLAVAGVDNRMRATYKFATGIIGVIIGILFLIFNKGNDWWLGLVFIGLGFFWIILGKIAWDISKPALEGRIYDKE